jgi:hypothetical protein
MFMEAHVTDDLSPGVIRADGATLFRHSHRLLETCSVCSRLFDLRKQPEEMRGRYCSPACVTTARRLQINAPSEAA